MKVVRPTKHFAPKQVKPVAIAATPPRAATSSKNHKGAEGA